MFNTSLALRYARAFYKIAASVGKAEKVEENLGDISRTIGASSDLKRVLYHPGITPDEKKRVLNEVFSGDCESVSLKFLGYLIDKKRIFQCGAISQCFSEMLDEDQNRVNVRVESFSPLNGETLKKIKERLTKNLGKEIAIATEVIPSLMGGMRIILGDKVIDGSIAHQVRRLSETVTAF